MDAKTRETIAAAVAALNTAAVALGSLLDEPAKVTTPAPAKATAKKATKKAQPASLVAAKAHCYEARMVRRNTTVLGGLTAKERSALYAANPQIHGLAAAERSAAWEAIVVAYKAA